LGTILFGVPMPNRIIFRNKPAFHELFCKKREWRWGGIHLLSVQLQGCLRSVANEAISLCKKFLVARYNAIFLLF